MAIIQREDKTEVLQLPEILPGVEKGDWVKIYVQNSSARQRAVRNRARELAGKDDFDDVDENQALIENIVVATSDCEEPTAEDIASINPMVRTWIYTEYLKRTVLRRTEEEKKVSLLPSSGTQVPDTVASRKNSPISRRSAG